MTDSLTPPFRADHVGSLLRPAPVADARKRHAEGQIDDAELRAAEDAAIPALIRMQEEVGLKGCSPSIFFGKEITVLLSSRGLWNKWRMAIVKNTPA